MRSDPIQRAADGARDLYDVATWERRSALDGVSIAVHWTLRVGAQALVVLLAVVIVGAFYLVDDFVGDGSDWRAGQTPTAVAGDRSLDGDLGRVVRGEDGVRDIAAHADRDHDEPDQEEDAEQLRQVLGDDDEHDPADDGGEQGGQRDDHELCHSPLRVAHWVALGAMALSQTVR